jgi:sec-independent protein translocase protein TatA
MMGLDNPIHLAFLLILLLLVFGAKRLPEMGRSLGSGLRGFKESVSGEEPSVHLHTEPAPVHTSELTMPATVTVPMTNDAVNEPTPAQPVA